VSAEKETDLLFDVATSGLSLDVAALDYVEVQICRDTWDELQEWKKTADPVTDLGRWPFIEGER
jgi:hypothetical protein